MKIVYMGTPDFAVGALEALIEAGHEITAVVTQPDKAKGRSDKLSYSPVKECALRHNIPVFQPVKIKRPESVEELRKYEADVFVVAAFGQILSKEILDMPRLGSICIHASLLPKLRGSSPIQWAIINGEEKTGITIMQMDPGIDTGDILYKKEIDIAKDETGDSLFERLSVLGAETIIEALPKLERGELTPIPQNNEEATHTVMLNKEMGLLDFSKDATTIERLVRGLNSWPSAYTHLNGKVLKIWKASVCTDENVIREKKDRTLGMVFSKDRDTIYIACKDSVLAVYEVQLEGKKRMSIHDFLLGNPNIAGVELG